MKSKNIEEHRRMAHEINNFMKFYETHICYHLTRINHFMQCDEIVPRETTSI